MSAPTQLSPAELFAKLNAASLDGNWTLDASKSTVTIASKSMWGLAKVNGAFTSVSGHATVSGGSVTGTISISADSINTKNAKRDSHLKSDAFFASQTYPELVFTLDSATPKASTVTLNGTLSVRDTVRPVSFDATVGVEGDREITLNGALEIDRSDYGMTWNQLGMASMSNAVTIKAVFVRG